MKNDSKLFAFRWLSSYQEGQWDFNMLTAALNANFNVQNSPDFYQRALTTILWDPNKDTIEKHVLALRTLVMQAFPSLPREWPNLTRVHFLTSMPGSFYEYVSGRQNEPLEDLVKGIRAVTAFKKEQGTLKSSADDKRAIAYQNIPPTVQRGEIANMEYRAPQQYSNPTVPQPSSQPYFYQYPYPAAQQVSFQDQVQTTAYTPPSRPPRGMTGAGNRPLYNVEPPPAQHGPQGEFYCYYCHGKGHLKRACTSREQMRSPRGRGIAQRGQGHRDPPPLTNRVAQPMAPPFQQSAPPFQHPAHNMQQSNANFSQPAPSFSQPAPSFSQPAPSFSQPTPSFRQPAPFTRPPAPNPQLPASFSQPSASAYVPTPTAEQPFCPSTEYYQNADTPQEAGTEPEDAYQPGTGARELWPAWDAGPSADEQAEMQHVQQQQEQGEWGGYMYVPPTSSGPMEQQQIQGEWGGYTHVPPTASAEAVEKASASEEYDQNSDVSIYAAVGPDHLQWVRTPRINILVEGVEVEAVADTGAGPALIVSKAMAHKFLHKRHEPRDAAKLISSVGKSVTLTNCDGEPVRIAGQAYVEVEYAGTTITTPMLISASAADDATVLIGCFAMLQFNFQLTNGKGENLLQQAVSYGQDNIQSLLPLPHSVNSPVVSYACTIHDEAIYIKAGIEAFVKVQVPIGSAYVGGAYYFTPTPGFYPQVEMMDGVVEVDKDGAFLLPIGNPFETLARFSKGDQVGIIEPTHTVTFKEWQYSLYAETFGPANPPAVTSESARSVAAGEGSLRLPSAPSAKPATEQTPPPKATSSCEGDQLLKRLGKLKEMLRVGPDAKPNDVKKLRRLVMKYHDVFAVEDDELGDCDWLQEGIDTGDVEPIQQPLCRTPLLQREKIATEVEKLLKMGIITKSMSDWAQPLIAVSKKDGGTRICVDFRRLNAITRSNAYPLPRTAHLLERIGASLGYRPEDPEWEPKMSKLDVKMQVRIKEQDRHKTAFRTHRGLYEFVRLPMGLKTAGSIFQRLMNDTLHGLLDDGIFCYLDNIAIATDTLAKHLSRLERIFLRFRTARLKLKPSKCDFLESQLGYLGHVLSSDGLRTDPTNMEAIEKFPPPKNQQQVRSFYGLASYYRHFVKNFAHLSSGLIPLLKKDIIFVWTDEAQKSFEILKQALSTPPVLHYPDISKKEYYIEMDASILGVGAVLSQPMLDGKQQTRPIAYASRVLNDAEKNYPITEIEALACVYAIKQFKSYIFGTTVHLTLDPAVLPFLRHQKEPTGRIHKWISALNNYNIVWHYRKGTLNKAFDALSQNPVGSPKAGGLDEWTECYCMTMKGAKLNTGIKAVTKRSKKRRLQDLALIDHDQSKLDGDEVIDKRLSDQNTAEGGGKQGAADGLGEPGAADGQGEQGVNDDFTPPPLPPSGLPELPPPPPPLGNDDYNVDWSCPSPDEPPHEYATESTCWANKTQEGSDLSNSSFLQLGATVTAVSTTSASNEKDTMQRKKQKSISPQGKDEATVEQLRAKLVEAQGEAKQWEEAVDKHKVLLEEALGRVNDLEKRMQERKVMSQPQLQQVKAQDQHYQTNHIPEMPGMSRPHQLSRDYREKWSKSSAQRQAMVDQLVSAVQRVMAQMYVAVPSVPVPQGRRSARRPRRWCSWRLSRWRRPTDLSRSTAENSDISQFIIHA
ncbi:MAG: hypothetical protein GY820_09955 [Gammaproteobacteria bacterium]|nr:hypothetical protein [Gammaproteobacteria bacterium]